MAHDLDRRPEGTAAMFSVDATPWNREGTILREAPSLKEALELGGLDFNVDVRPLYLRTQTTPELPDVFTYECAADVTRPDDGDDVLREQRFSLSSDLLPIRLVRGAMPVRGLDRVRWCLWWRASDRARRRGPPPF